MQFILIRREHSIIQTIRDVVLVYRVVEKGSGGLLYGYTVLLVATERMLSKVMKYPIQLEIVAILSAWFS